MIDVNCPKCKEALQFPFMICPDCKWNASGQTVSKHAHLAEMYISEHPEDRDQLKMVLDMVMKDKIQESEMVRQRRKRNAEMGRKIRVWHIILSGLFGTVWIWFGAFILIASSDGEPVPISMEICALNIASMASLLTAGILLLLKLISLKDQ